MDAPARNRTWTTGSGDLCDILFTTGAVIVWGGLDRLPRGPRVVNSAVFACAANGVIGEAPTE